MTFLAPHFLLYSDVGPLEDGGELRGWRFVLHSKDGSERLEASDVESNMSRSRLELLSVIRGLEALDQPSNVTLVTSSRYVGSGLHHGLEQWRETDYQWDEFGVMTPIKNEDLWRRLDHALEFHELDCRVRKGQGVPADLAVKFRVDRGHLSAPPRATTDAFDIESARADVAMTSRSLVKSLPTTTPAVLDESREHWPRKRRAGHRIVAALGTVAAAAAVVLAVGR